MQTNIVSDLPGVAPIQDTNLKNPWGMSFSGTSPIYQGRLWPGFHRHAVSVMLAYSFLVWQEWQQRQERTRSGRPRRPLSPRPDRRRMSLPEVHRQVCDWLRLEAAKELLLRELMSVPERIPA